MLAVSVVIDQYLFAPSLSTVLHCSNSVITQDSNSVDPTPAQRVCGRSQSTHAYKPFLDLDTSWSLLWSTKMAGTQESANPLQADVSTAN